VSSLRVEQVVTSGIFSLDGGDFEVDNNIWIVGDDTSVVIIDAAHDAAAIAAAVNGRAVEAIICTHGHNDHINAAVALADLVDAPILLHSDDRMLWDTVHPDRKPNGGITDGDVIGQLQAMHTPGHSPGGVCLLGLGELADHVFSGDTLFNGGPGATGRSFSDFPTIVDSISAKLLPLPVETLVHTGHGDDTTIGAEAPHLQEWIARGR
jgi:glyoxylase-like metal-dependent hydrolase (beta-lactamase superfamily II)